MKIVIQNLSHIYDRSTSNEFLALDNILLETLPQGITAFVGNNGSGKTTLIKHLNALLFPTSGQLQVGSNLIVPRLKPKRKIKDILKYRQDVGMVFQFPEEQFFAETVAEEIAFGIKALKQDLTNIDARVIQALEQVGLDANFASKNPFALSDGQKRRVALASILVLDQKLLILDEPTASLDVKAVSEIYHLIKNLAAQGKKIIIVTHDLQSVLEHADEVVVFDEAKIVASGKPLDILYQKDFLKMHKLAVPKLVQAVQVLQENKIKVPNVKSTNELIAFLQKGLHE